jgi:hypothetical protein
MAESTNILQNVKIKPSWTGTYTLTNTDADYLVSGQNLVVGFQKLNAWIAKFDTDVEGVRTVAKGGTGKGTLTTNAVLLGNGTTAIKEIASASGAFYATAANAEPQFGTLPVAQGGTGATSAADARTNLDVYSKAETDAKIDDRLQELSVMNIKGTVAKFDALPSTNVNTGDLYLVGTADATNDSFEEYVYTSQGWEYLGKHQVEQSVATDDDAGIVRLSDATNGTEDAENGGKAATPLAVKTAMDRANAAYTLADSKVKVSASADIASTATGAYKIGTVTITGSTNGVDGTPTVVDLYGRDTTLPGAEKGVTFDSTSNKYKASLVSETANTYAVGSANAPELTAVQLDSNGKLAVAESKVKQNVFAFGTNDSNKGYYPLLFANSKITPSTDPPTTTAHITGGALATETGETNKYSHLFVQIDKNTVDNVTTETATLYADMFIGMTATPAINTDNSQLASTAFVHDVVDDALANGLANALVGAKGITIAKDTDSSSATYGKYVVSHTHTDITADTTGAFKKLKYDAQGHVTGTADVVTTDLAGLTGAITPVTGDDADGDKVLTAKTVGGTTTTQWEDWSVLELNCVAD